MQWITSAEGYVMLYSGVNCMQMALRTAILGGWVMQKDRAKSEFIAEESTICIRTV